MPTFPARCRSPREPRSAAWSELGGRGSRAPGCSKLVVVNSHGGNSPVIDILAQELRATLNLLVVKASWPRFGYPDGLFEAAELAHGIHGGAIETSLMLAFRPDLVRMDAARDAVPASVAIEQRFAQLRTGRPTGFGWMAQDLHESGVAGDATKASAEAGEACAAYGAAAFIALLRDIAAFDLAGLIRR